MLSVDTALEIILKTISPLANETVSLYEALGRVLGDDIFSTLDLPPFANSSMDGYAVIASDVNGASKESPITLVVVEDIPAGHAPQFTLKSGQAARIMTGAPVPTGATAIVPVEDTNDTQRGPQAPETITIFTAVKLGDYIRPVGEDLRNHDLVLKKGRILRPSDLGVLAGLGYSTIDVIQRPRVALISTGDELLTPDQPLTPGKIRDMNSYTLGALITEYGGEPLYLGIAGDTVEAVEDHFQQAIDHKADLILSSAGVSVGAFDVVKTVLEKLGQADFWKVNMRPGKPLTFGHVHGIPFLGLPGNPVSSMVSFEVFGRAVIRKMLGLHWQLDEHVVRVGETIQSDGRMTFARVRLVIEDGETVAYITGTQSSGAISSMVKADALLIIPEGVVQVNRGDRLGIRPLHFTN